jgi:hypothetical protein
LVFFIFCCVDSTTPSGRESTPTINGSAVPRIYRSTSGGGKKKRHCSPAARLSLGHNTRLFPMLGEDDDADLDSDSDAGVDLRVEVDQAADLTSVPYNTDVRQPPFFMNFFFLALS